jgi:hypothetical protein
VASDFWDAVESLLDERANEIGSRRALAARLFELDQRQTQASWLRSLKRYGSGSVPNEETALLIARAFDVNRDDLPAVERLSLQTLDYRARVVEAKGVAMEQVVGDHLRELAAKLADADERLATLKRSHDRLQRRVRTLEVSLDEPDATATTGRGSG